MTSLLSLSGFVQIDIEDTNWQVIVLIRESVIRDQIRNVSEKNISTSRYQIV